LRSRKYIYPLIKTDGGYTPQIPIRITNPFNGLSLNCYALIDTGADCCVFPQYVAEKTGHNLKGDGVKSYISQGVGENCVNVFQHTFMIELFAFDRKTIIWSSKQETIGCVNHDNIPPLLGFNDFVSQFIISFDYVTRTITIEIPIKDR
jgi:hypothetical protein